ncbi:MAG: response regulator [Alphaproteobacteria bacterium]|nr:response regulator [Alphaproteobacteria bacterium]
MDQNKEKMEALMRPLRQKYLTQLRERYTVLAQYQSQGAWGEADRKAVTVLAHKLNGSGETYGYMAISLAARGLEDELLAGATNVEDAMRALMDSIEIALENDQADDVSVDEPESADAAEMDLPVILLVDDDPDIVELIQSVFAGKAHVRTVTDVGAAMQVLQSENPALVFLDDQMPGMTGLEMLEALEKAGGIEVPVMMLTASAAPEKVMRGLVSGAVDYITKPFDPAALVDKAMQRISRGKITILIADDDAPVRDILAHRFKAVGCSVVTASDGTRALEIMREKPPQLAVLDRMMPGLDGLVVLQQMQEDEILSDVPVVFLTARHQEQAVLEGLNLGAADYIVKPFNPEEVVARCMRFVRKRKGG